MNKLFKNEKTLKAVIVTLIVALVSLGGVTIASFADQGSGKNINDGIKTTAKTATNDETVYLLTDPDGSINQKIVSENGTLHYEGYEDCNVPVTMKIAYTLDGKSVTSKELAGKSGHVVINFSYTNHEKYDSVYVPFMAITGLILDNQYFSNIDVTNGRAVDDGNRNVVVGYSFPGMQESLGVSKSTVDVPETVTIAADVENFQIDTMYTLMTNEVFSEMDLGSVSNLGDLKDQLNKLKSASGELLSGTDQIYKGTEQLQTGAKKLSEGTTALKKGSDKLYQGSTQLQTGAESLAGGLSQLASNSSTLNNGAKQIFDSSLKTADAQLADLRTAFTQMGKTIPALDETNYNTVLDTVIQTLQAIDQQKGTTQYTAVVKQLQGAKSQLDSVATFYKGVITYTAGVDSASQGATKLNAGTQGIVTGSKQLSEGLVTLQKGESSLTQGINKLNKGAKALNEGVKEMSDKGLSQLSKLSGSDLTKVLNNVNKLEAAAKSYNSFGGKGSYNSVKFIYKTDQVSPK